MAQATIQTTVTGLQDTPVSATPPTVGQVLVFNGTSWVPSGAINGPLSITGALTAGSLNAGAAALSGPLTSTNNISTSGNLAVTGSGQIQSPGNAGALVNVNGTNLVSGRAFAQKNVLSTQFGTTSNSAIMCGADVQFTPRTSGTVMLSGSCQIANNTAGSNANVGIAYGSGTPPAQGAPLTGNPTGYGPTLGGNNPANMWVPWSQCVIVSGLTIGTTYWVDFIITSNSNNGSTAFIQWASMWVAEI